MSDPIFPIIETDAAELYEIGMARIAELATDFDTDVVASPESWLMEAVAEVASEIQSAASSVPRSIFRYYGETMLDIPLNEGVQASASITVTCGDTDGHTIDEGTAFLLYLDGDTAYEFACVEDIVIPNASDTATFTVVCSTATSESNGAGVAGVELVDSLSFVSSVVIDAVASLGTDDETDDEYVDRLADTLQLLSTRPITTHDFEIACRAQFGGRWLCLDTYDAVALTWNNPLTVTMVGIKDDGTVFTAPERAAVVAFLDANTMVNFVNYAIDPTIEPVDVSFDITVAEGFDSADTLALAEANVAEYLSPANWGMPASGDEVRWDVTNEVKYFAVVNVILNTVGVATLDALTIDGLTVDYALTDDWTLADSGTITGAIT